MDNKVHVDCQHLANLSIEVFPERIPYIGFDSRSEAVCAILMERYIKGWECELGKTFQVPLVSNRKADFLVAPGVLFEYHPITLHRDLISDDARQTFDRYLKHYKRWLAEEIREAVKSELYFQYCARRQIIARATPGFETAEVIVCTDHRTTWRKIIQRFSDNPPGLKQWTYEWNELMRGLEKQ